MRTFRLFLVLVALRTSSWAAQDVLTYHNDNARTGQNLNETILNTSNVNMNTFGKLFILAADGKVDAQPLYVSNLTLGTGTRNVVFVATEHDSVYAYDADTGALLWRVTMLQSGETPSDDRGCSQVIPEIGVTATPVIDRLSGPHGTIYLVAMSKDSSGNYRQRLHALDITTGSEEFGGPVDIEATYPGTGAEGDGTTLTFDPKQHKARASLLLLNDIVYVAWSSHCDINPYTAWIMGYDKSTLVRTRLLNITPNGIEGSVWQSGAGLAADSGGNIYFLTANGTADTTLNAQGFPSSGDYGNAFMKLSTGGSALAVADYFNMFNTVSESNDDEDLGSGGALVLPDMTDSNNVTWRLAVGAGKDDNIYLVNRDNMGQFSSKTNRIYQQVAAPLAGGEFGMAAYFNNAIYYGSVGDHLKMFPFLNAKLTGPSSQTLIAFNYPGTTPSVSANGTANGIVWATENTDPAVLHAYDAMNLATEFYNSNQAAKGRDHFGAGNKFITPMIANGKVYVGTTSGVGVFGLITATSAQPVISAISPAIAIQGTTSQAILAGVNLSGATSVTVSGAGVTATIQSGGTDTQLPLSLTVDATATLGARSITVITAGGSYTLDSALSIQAPAITVPTTTPQPITEVEQGIIHSGYIILTPDTNTTAPTPQVTFGIVKGGLVQSQAGMFPGPMTTDASLFVEVIPGIGRNLGVALANPGSTTNTITLTMRDAGGTLAGTPVTVLLQPQQQIAKFVTEMFSSSVIGAGFRGSLEAQSSTPFAVLGLRFSGTDFSTFPMLMNGTTPGVTSRVLTSGSTPNTPLAGNIGGNTAAVIPQFAMGGGWATQIAIVNDTANKMSGRIDAFDASGNPMAVKLNGATQSTFTYSIPANGAFVLAPRDANGQSPF